MYLRDALMHCMKLLPLEFMRTAYFGERMTSIQGSSLLTSKLASLPSGYCRFGSCSTTQSYPIHRSENDAGIHSWSLRAYRRHCIPLYLPFSQCLVSHLPIWEPMICHQNQVHVNVDTAIIPLRPKLYEFGLYHLPSGHGDGIYITVFPTILLSVIHVSLLWLLQRCRLYYIVR